MKKGNVKNRPHGGQLSKAEMKDRRERILKEENDLAVLIDTANPDEAIELYKKLGEHGIDLTTKEKHGYSLGQFIANQYIKTKTGADRRLSAYDLIETFKKKHTPTPAAEEGKEEEEQPNLPGQGNPNEFKVHCSMAGSKLKVLIKDSGGNVVSMDFVRISSIHRVNYNVVTGELIIVFPETKGWIDVKELPVMKNGKPTGGIREITQGEISSFKTSLLDRHNIEIFLKAYLEVEELTDESFDGFILHQKAQDLIDNAIKQKRDEMNKISPILSETGEQIIKGNDGDSISKDIAQDGN